MTDKLFTKRLRDLTDEAIRESLAEISGEFEKRFGLAALTASPPVVEREAIAKKYVLPVKRREDYSGEHREWIEEYTLPDWLVRDIAADAILAPIPVVETTDE